VTTRRIAAAEDRGGKKDEKESMKKEGSADFGWMSREREKREKATSLNLAVGSASHLGGVCLDWSGG